jgi:hypothetical protein
MQSRRRASKQSIKAAPPDLCQPRALISILGLLFFLSTGVCWMTARMPCPEITCEGMELRTAGFPLRAGTGSSSTNYRVHEATTTYGTESRTLVLSRAQTSPKTWCLPFNSSQSSSVTKNYRWERRRVAVEAGAWRERGQSRAGETVVVVRV